MPTVEAWGRPPKETAPGRGNSELPLAPGLRVEAIARAENRVVERVGGPIEALSIVDVHDLHAVRVVASVLVLAEIAISIGALVAIVVLLVKRRFDWALGLFLGWLVGPVGATVLALAQTDSVN